MSEQHLLVFLLQVLLLPGLARGFGEVLRRALRAQDLVRVRLERPRGPPPS